MTEIKPTAEQNTAPLRIAFAKPLTPSNKTGDKTQELEELIKVFLSPDAFTIVEEGKNVAKYVSSRYDDEVHYRHVQFGDYIGICDMDTGKGNLDAEYTIVFERDGDKETNMTFSVIEGEKGALSYQAIRDLFADDAQVAELNARLDAYAAEYLSQIVYHGAA